MMLYNPQDVLVAMALKEEGGQALIDAGARVIYTGLGKVNATYQLTKAIVTNKPKLVINFGTAGSKLFNRGEIVSVHRFLQRDMDVSPLGFKPFETPFEDTPLFLDFTPVFTHLPQATVGTGDSFETDHANDRGEVVDMEAYAMAKVCFLEGIDFASVKYISDGANEHASNQWQESLAKLPNTFVKLYLSLINK